MTSVAVTAKELEAEIASNGHGHVLEIYKKKRGLDQKHKRLVFQDACKLGFRKFGSSLGQRANVLKVASAIMVVFSDEYPSINMLVPATGRKSALFYAAQNRVRIEKNNKMEAEGGPDDQNDNIDHESESSTCAESIDDQMTYLKYAIHTDKAGIEKYLRTSFDHRHQLLNDPNTDLAVLEGLVFDFFVANPNWINFEYELMFKNSLTLEAHQHLLKWDFLVKIDHSLENMAFTVEENVKVFFGLIRLVGYNSPKTKTGGPADNFQAARERLVEFYEGHTLNSTIFDETTNSQPFLVGKISSDTESVDQFFIVSRPHVIPLDPRLSFLKCFDLLFKFYHIFNMVYPASLQKFYYLFEEFFYGIKKNDIPRNTQLYHKLVMVHKEYDRSLTEMRGISNEPLLVLEVPNNPTDEANETTMNDLDVEQDLATFEEFEVLNEG